MNFLDIKPSKRTPEEAELEILREKYEQHFGKPYTFCIGISDMTMSETINDIKRRIATNEPQEEFKTEKDLIY